MRSKMIIVASVVAGLVLASQMAAADPVQEQLRLMEQRMAEMEDRLQATSTELQAAKETVDQQQGLLTDAGLVEEDDFGLRSATGKFLQQVEISGVMAASYNHRFKGSGDGNQDNIGLFRHPHANTFAFDQFWLTFHKEPTSEDRAGMHVDLVYGESATAQKGSRNVIDTSGSPSGDTIAGDDFLVYSAFASFLIPHGDAGVQLDLGRLATPLGAEVLQTNMNFNITQGLVWGLQPVTHTGVQISHAFTDSLGFTFGVVNDVYDQSSWDDSRDKAYYAQFAHSSDMFGISVGAILGKDSSSEYINENGDTCRSGDECKTAVFNVVMTADPTDNVSLWADYTMVRSFGDDIAHKGYVHGISVAGRVGITDATGVATRVEYVRTDQNFSRASGSNANTGEIVSVTLTGDHALTDCMKLRIEGRYDINLSNAAVFANGSATGQTTRRMGQLVGLAEIYYEF